MRKNNNIHFEISERKILLRVFDVSFVLFTLYLVSSFFSFDYFRIASTNYYWTIVLAIYISIIGTVFEMYDLQTASAKIPVTKSVLLTASVTTLFYLLTPFYTPTLPNNRLQILYFFFSILIALLLWRFLYITFLASHRFVKKVIFIGNSKKIEKYVAELTKVNPHYIVVGYVASDEKVSINNLKEIEIENLVTEIIANSITEIVVADDNIKGDSKGLYAQLLSIIEKGIVIRQYSEVYETSTYRLPIQFDDKELYKFFPFSRSNQNAFYLCYVRLLDIIASIVGVLFILVIMPFLAIFNLIWNKGPMFYTQQRVGKNGLPFTIYKLRSMVINAEANGAVFAQTNDSRVTAFGKFLRKTRLDEIPQFYNVLKGEMSIIGPRPERPVFVEEIASKIPLYQTRHVIKPGLTGWAQVNYPYGANLEDSLMKLRYDLYYIKHRSLFLDINIIIKTLGTVLFAKGQ
jgi:exopolysaccharide biosynthesis polyprenyl glycosylphosphotransferase